MLGDIHSAFDKRAVDGQLGSVSRQLLFPPRLDQPAHGLEVTLHSVHAHRQGVLQREVLAVFRQDGCVVTLKREVSTDILPPPANHSEPFPSES